MYYYDLLDVLCDGGRERRDRVRIFQAYQCNSYCTLPILALRYCRRVYSQIRDSKQLRGAVPRLLIKYPIRYDWMMQWVLIWVSP